MADTTLGRMQDEVLAAIALDDPETRTQSKRWLNWAYEKFLLGHPWPSRRAIYTVETVAPYETGTISVSGAAVTGVGTTFTSAMDERKLALSLSNAPYRISAFGSTTTLTLGRSWTGTEPSGESYIIYDDELVLDSLRNGAVLLEDEIVLLNNGHDYPLNRVDDVTFLERGVLPVTNSRPTQYRTIEDSATGQLQIQVWPVPDAAYAVQVPYLKGTTEMVKAGDEPSGVEEVNRHILVTGALRFGYRMTGEIRKADNSYAMFRNDMREAWDDERGTVPTTGQLRPFDLPVGYRRGRSGRQRGNFRINYYG